MSGDLPYRPEKVNLGKMIEALEKQQIDPLPETYSQDLRDLVNQMLSVDPSKRITIKEILALPLIHKFKRQ